MNFRDVEFRLQRRLARLAKNASRGGLNMDIDLYKSVVAFVRKTNKASVSHIQRNFHLGYARASEIMDKLESEYVVSRMSASGRRDVYPEIVANLNAEIDELKTKLEAAQVPDGFVLINAESLALRAKSIRMFNNGDNEDDCYEIENHVCAIEAMIEAAQGEGHG